VGENYVVLVYCCLRLSFLFLIYRDCG